MKYIRIKHLLPLAILFFSCATKKVTNTAVWVNPAKANNMYHNIYVLGMLATSFNNITVESEMATMAGQRGIMTTRNFDVQPANEISQEMRKDLALMKVKQYACDAICTIGVKDVLSESHYVQGSTLYVSGYVPYGTYNYYNQFPSYYANYYGHVGMGGYYSSAGVELTPGKLKTEKTYFVECNLFDASTYELLFSIQSEAFNPKDIEVVSKEYCTAIFKTLENKGVIKPRNKK